MGSKSTLTELKSGTSCKVLEVQGGRNAVSRLEALGIHPGVKLLKKSQLIGHGPVTVEINSHQVALGHGIAHKVLVETL